MQSMTGYGRGRVSREGRDIQVELKAVNHRFLDISFRVPKQIAFLEETLRALLNAGEARRGHIDVTVTYANGRPDAANVQIDHALLSRCSQETRHAAEALGLAPPSLGELIQLSGALGVSQADEDAQIVCELAQEAYTLAFDALCEMRRREGSALLADLTQNLAQAEAIAQEIDERAPMVPSQYRERLLARLTEWETQDVEPQRVAQEVALAADKCAIDEEMSRLKSHITQFRLCLTEGGEVGRRMDFLLQEMNREVNTIGSKAADVHIAQRVVEIKCILEKLREQAQNIV